ncbi:Ger(x)C family spore germination protein [Paenibacillus harenae]|uniref:Ger(x)C family spore germination protein n=1 Tax=Paenibacillus harenae TaxID=306543 RepID=UPI000409FA60|nr:Ger(x)C family spore germination protein [Paenibacillus harenae]
MRTCRSFCLLMLLSLLLLPGCWNSRELSDMAIVIGIGIDKIPDTDQYRVSLQIVNPGSVVTSKSGSGGQNLMPNVVYSSVDHTVFSAMRKSSQKVPRRLFFAHSQLLVIGEALAKDGIDDLFDFYERSHELRLNTSVVIAKGTDAESLLRVLIPLQTTTTTAITGRIKVTSESWAQSVDTTISDIVKSLVGEGAPVISGIRVTGNPSKGQKKENLEQSTPLSNVETKGIAVFTDGKLAGWLEGKSARGAVWALDKMKSTIVNIDCEDKKDAMAIEITFSTTKVKAHLINGKPSFTIQVTEEGNLSETKCPINPKTHEVIAKLQQQLAEETKKEIELAVKAAQLTRSDIFGFATVIKRTYPKDWKKMKENWPALYSESEVKVSVKAYVRRTGLRFKSYIKPKEE